MKAQVKDVNVRRVLDHYGVYYEEDPRSTELMYLCPFHGDTNLGSAFFDEEEFVYYCFSCSEGGNVIQFVSLLEDCSYDKAKQLVESGFKEVVDYDTLYKRRMDKITKTNTTSRQYQDLSEATILRMLTRMENLSESEYGYWLRIATYLSFVEKKDIDSKYKQVIPVYGEFLQGIRLDS